MALLAVPVCAILDIARTTDAQWEAIGRNRLAWMAPIMMGTMLLLAPGVALSGLYFARVRPKLQAVEDGRR
jgi:hypothetical protein